jgi:hypothetical protein
MSGAVPFAHLLISTTGRHAGTMSHFSDFPTRDLRDREAIGSMRLFDAGGLLAEDSAHR